MFEHQTRLQLQTAVIRVMRLPFEHFHLFPIQCGPMPRQ